MRPLSLAAVLACAAAYTAPDQASFALSEWETAALADVGNSSAREPTLMQAAVRTAASSKAAKTCDPSWCNCKDRSCVVPDESEGCDLCSQKWLFVLSAGGRTGSKSLLEGLNALPGVSLSGENFAVLDDLRAAYDKAADAARRNMNGQSPAAYFVPKPEGLLKHTLCVQQSMFARLAGRKSEQAGQIHGFTELLQLPSFETGGKFASGGSHLSTRPEVRQEWIEFLETLFPCSRIVLNLRRDRAAQARAITSSLFDTSGDHFSAPPLDLVEKELETMSQFMLEWHQNRSSTGRSFLMYAEELTAERFTELAQWLGQPCTFGSADVSCIKPGPPQTAKEAANYVSRFII